MPCVQAAAAVANTVRRGAGAAVHSVDSNPSEQLYENAQTNMLRADAKLTCDITGAPVSESVKVELVPVVCSTKETPCQDVELARMALMLLCRFMLLVTGSNVIKCNCRQCSAWLTVFVKTQGPSSVGGRP